MARFLALDWDHQQLHVVSAVVSGGNVRVQRAAVWQEEQSPNPAEAEALGRLLRDRLKAAGIAAAPVLACVGRDRVIVKEIRYPAVPPAEEAAVVRFQTIKELSDPAEEVVIDFVPAGESSTTGERRALVLVLRREMLAAYQALCRGAGLKLAAITPRPYGSAACLGRVAGTTVLTPKPNPADAPVALLVVSDRWAEFCVVRGEALLMARPVAAGSTLAGEVRRSLAVYAGQAPQQPVKALYLAGSAEHAALRSQLQDVLRIPVHPLDPFAGADKAEVPGGHHGSFTGAVGLLHLQADRRPLPVNFVKPREPKPPVDPNRRRYALAGALVAALLLAVGSYSYAKLSERDAELERLTLMKMGLDKELTDLEEDARRMKAIGDWADAEVVWLDELYDLTDRVADPNAVRLTNLTGAPLTRTAKSKHVAQMTLTGITTEDLKPVDDLLSQMVKDDHYGVGAKELRPNSGLDRFRFRQQFTSKVAIEKLPPSKYVRRLPAPPEDPRSRRNRRGEDEDLGGFGGFGFGGEQP